MTEQELQAAIADAGHCLHVLASWPGDVRPGTTSMRTLGIMQAIEIQRWAESQLKQLKGHLQ